MVSKIKDSIGSKLSEREAMNLDDGYSLMGFKAVNSQAVFGAGAHFIGIGKDKTMTNDQG